MGLLGAFSRRVSRPAALHVKSGDAFAVCAERLGLTPREGEIVRLLLEGKDSRRITEELFISDHTVKNHIHHIYQKLDIKNRIQLVRCFQSVLEDPGRPPETGGAAAGGQAFFLRTALPAAVLLIVMAAMALVAWRPWGQRPRPAAFPPLPALAVLDFENLSSDPELEKWVTGLPLLLATDLAQSKHIRTLSDDTVYGALKKFDLTGRKRYSREELRRLAKEMKADYLISGSLLTAGGKIVLTAFLRDARTGAAIRTEQLDCQDEKDLMLKADGLGRLIRSSLTRRAAQGQDDIDLDIEVLTTTSALAYKYYSEGWRYHRTGDYEQSLLMLKKAVEIDPEFAMAYRMMAVDSRNLRYWEREAEYLRKAFELTDRLPEDCRERHLIRADYYSESEATRELAAVEFKKVLEDHPYDLVANNNLGILCYELEDFEDAARYADVPVRQGTSDPFPHYTKAISLRALGRTSEALRGLVAYHENYPANRLIYQTLVATLIGSGDLAGAAAALDKAVSVFPDPSWSNWKGSLLLLTEGAAAAREEFRKLFLMEEAPWRLGAHQRLALVELAAGRYSEAEKECRDGAELAESIGESAWSTDFRRLLGQILLEEGKHDSALVELRRAFARAAPDSLRARAVMLPLAQAFARTGDQAGVDDLTRRFQAAARSGTNRRLARDLDFFLGIVEFERGRFREAVAALEKGVARLPAGRVPAYFDPLMCLYLGQARAKAGDPAGAAAVFEEILSSNADRLWLGDLYPLAVLGRAQAEESLGRQASALEAYRSFLALWVDADPERPEIGEARTRLKVLSASSGQTR